MISAELLALLRCPETQRPLAVAPVALVEELERARAARALRKTNGESIEQPIVAGLISEGGDWFYPVLDGIPVLLTPEAIRLR